MCSSSAQEVEIIGLDYREVASPLKKMVGPELSTTPTKIPKRVGERFQMVPNRSSARNHRPTVRRVLIVTDEAKKAPEGISPSFELNEDQ